MFEISSTLFVSKSRSIIGVLSLRNLLITVKCEENN